MHPTEVRGKQFYINTIMYEAFGVTATRSPLGMWSIRHGKVTPRIGNAIPTSYVPRLAKHLEVAGAPKNIRRTPLRVTMSPYDAGWLFLEGELTYSDMHNAVETDGQIEIRLVRVMRYCATTIIDRDLDSGIIFPDQSDAVIEV